MILRALNNQSKTITGAAVIIASATLISRIIGLFRDRFFAHYFGAGSVMDAYHAAFKIPDLIYTLLIIGALTAGFIPTFTKIFNQSELKGPAWKLANNIFNIIGIILIFFSILGIIFSNYLVPLIAPGFSAENTQLAIKLARIMFLSPIILGLSMTLGGILQSLRRFVFYSIAPIFYNIGIIIGITIFSKFIGPAGLAWGVVLGALMHFTLLYIGAKQAGWKWQWQLNFKDRDTRTIGKLMIPRTISSAITEINIVITTVLASLLPVGSIAVYNYAANLQAVPIGILAIPFALAAFPVLSGAATNKNMELFVSSLSSTIRQILFLIIPFSILLMLLRAQVVRVVLGTGQFDWTATIQTADALAFFSFGLFAQGIIPLLSRAFFSLSDTKTPLFIALVAEIFAIISALILMKKIGVSGLAAATSIGAIISAFLLLVFLRRKLPSLDGEKIMNSLLKISIASLVMAVVVQLLKYPLANIFDLNYFWGILGQGFIAGITGLAVYLLICWMLKLPEIIQLKNAFSRKFLRHQNVITSDIIETKD